MRARTTRRYVVPVVLLTTLVLAAGCTKTDDDTGSDSPTSAGATTTVDAATDGSTTTTEPATRTTRGVTDTSVKVGGIVWMGQFSGIEAGVAARLDRTNSEGGVNGRTVELVAVEDDGNDSAANLAAAEQLVRQEEVFAILPMQSSAIGAVDFLIEEQVPFFGWGVNPAFCRNEIGFGITGCVSDPKLERGSNAMGTALKQRFDGDTDKSIAILAEDNDSGRGGIVLLQNSLEAIGFDVVYAEGAVPAPPTAVGDFTPFVNSLVESDGGEPPDMIMLQLSTTNAISMSDALQARYDGLVITPFYDPRLVGSPAFDGHLVLTQMLPYEWADENPALAQMIEDVDTYDAANGTETLHSLSVAAGYWAADFFLSVLEATGDDLTVEKFLATVNGGFEWEAPGVIGPSTWPENHGYPVPCAALSLVENGAYVRDVPLVCGENFEL
ncbi:MAG: ABC transporter substrate-binding protein [Acidimicrobiia bacterium]|nr:ABC transporter substrate-binding protein [Acidimicrobiia bacterium]